jgi:hypothetical protein
MKRMMRAMMMRRSTHTTGWTPWTRRGNSPRCRLSRLRGRRRRLSCCSVSRRTLTSGKPRRQQAEEESPRGHRGWPALRGREDPDPWIRQGCHHHHLSLARPTQW